MIFKHWWCVQCYHSTDFSSNVMGCRMYIPAAVLMDYVVNVQKIVPLFSEQTQNKLNWNCDLFYNVIFILYILFYFNLLYFYLSILLPFYCFVSFFLFCLVNALISFNFNIFVSLLLTFSVLCYFYFISWSFLWVYYKNTWPPEWSLNATYSRDINDICMTPGSHRNQTQRFWFLELF